MKTVESMDIVTYKSKSEQYFPTIFWIISTISWILLIITGWISIKWLNDDDYWVVWTIYVERNFEEYYYMPFQMHVSLLYIAFIFSLIITLFGCIFYLIKTGLQKDQQIINGMLGSFSKYHFIPHFFISALFILGECHNDKYDFQKNQKDMVIAGLIFSLLGLISMVFIYINTNLVNCRWWEILLLKKGAYSCFIILMWYYFCYDIYYVRRVDKVNDSYEQIWNWKRGCGLFFSIAFGIGSIAFSLIFKDLIVSFMNIVIYSGLLVYYLKIPNYFRKLKYLNKNGDLIVDIILLVLSVATICILLIKYREQCVKS